MRSDRRRSTLGETFRAARLVENARSAVSSSDESGVRLEVSSSSGACDTPGIRMNETHCECEEAASAQARPGRILGRGALALALCVLSGCAELPQNEGPVFGPGPGEPNPSSGVGPGVNQPGAPSAPGAGGVPATPGGAMPGVADAQGSGGAGGPGATDLRTIPIRHEANRIISRLTRRQYVNSSAALLVIDAAPFLHLVPEIAPNAGYANSGVAQSQPYDLILGFDAAASAMVEAVSDWAPLLQRYGNCFEASCVGQFIAEFGLRAFRRPISEAEQAAFGPILQAAADNQLEFVDTVQLLVRAFLQSPEFLYLFEDEVLSDHQIASRLSFFVTDGPPDDALLQDAAAGALSDPLNRAAHAERLLAAQGERFAQAFAYDFLGLRKAYQRTFNVDAPTVEGLVQSAQDTFASLLAADAPIGELFTTRTFASNPVVASFFGASDTTETLSSEQGNGFVGLLTHPATLMAMSNAVEGSMVSRGQFIAHQLLCIPPTPPPNMAFTAEDVSNLPPNPTPRQEGEARLAEPSCVGCHVQFEPYAFALSKWGGDGKQFFAEADDSGPIVTSLGEFQFAGYEEFLPQLAESEQFKQCMADHLLRYGLRHTAYQSELVATVLAAASSDGAAPTLRSLVRAIVSQPAFVSR